MNKLYINLTDNEPNYVFLITPHEYALQHIWALITNNSHISITELANSKL